MSDNEICIRYFLYQIKAKDRLLMVMYLITLSLDLFALF